MQRVVYAQLKDDHSLSLKGLLWEQRGEWFVLRNVELCKSGLHPTRIDGDVVIAVANVSFFQVPPP